MLSIGLAGCRESRPTPEYEVYDAVLTDLIQLVHDLPYSAQSVVVFDTTVNWYGWPEDEHPDVGEDLRRGLPHAGDDVVAAFVQRNATTLPLRDDFRIDLPVHMLSSEGFEEVRSARIFWKAMEQRFPRPIGPVMFSRVGLSDDGGQALVFCGLWGQEGFIQLLEREGRGWVAKQRIWTF